MKHRVINNQKQPKMRKAEFTVPGDVILDFVQELTEKKLTNEITGVTEDDELVIEVLYDKQESKVVDELEEHLDNLIGEE